MGKKKTAFFLALASILALSAIVSGCGIPQTGGETASLAGLQRAINANATVAASWVWAIRPIAPAGRRRPPAIPPPSRAERVTL
jgi:hypothetical protein